MREQIDLSDKGATYSHVSERFDSRFAQRSEQHGSLLARCTCIVGLHPDSATVPIVETALALGKPFAVVPCCVFLGDSGAPTAMATRSWDDYCAYLLRKAPPGTIAEAAAPKESLSFLFWGAGLVVFPIILIYTVTIYLVFRGKVRPMAEY